MLDGRKMAAEQASCSTKKKKILNVVNQVCSVKKGEERF